MLIAAAVAEVRTRLDTMVDRFAVALADVSRPGMEAKEVYRRVKSGKLLKDNAYAFCHLAADAVEAGLRRELDRLAPTEPGLPRTDTRDALTLVPLEEIDSKLALAALARPFDIAHAEILAVLAVRLGLLLKRGTLRGEAHPFRPDVFLQALAHAWHAFEPDSDAHGLIEPLLRPDLLFDFGPVYEAVARTLAEKSGQPDALDAVRFQKTDDGAAARAARATARAALAEQLRKLFGDDGGDDGVPLIPDVPGLPAGQGGWRPSAAAGFAAAPASRPAGTQEEQAPAADGVPDGGQARDRTDTAVAALETGIQAGQPTGAWPAHGATAAAGVHPRAGATSGVPGGPGAAGTSFGGAPTMGGAADARGFVPSSGDPGTASPGPSWPAGTVGHDRHGVGVPPFGGAHVARPAAGGAFLPSGAIRPGAGHAPGGPAGVAIGDLASSPAGGYGPLDAMLAGVRPGVVAPLADLLARLGEAGEAGARDADGAAGLPADAVDAGNAGADGDARGGSGIAIPHDVFYLPRLRERLPQGSLSRGDARTLDLLSRVFETVLLDAAIPAPTRALLQLLQVPVLKAALADREFFYEEAHPARRLVDLLSRLGWEQRTDEANPADPAAAAMLAAMRRSVAHVSGAGPDGAGNADFSAAVAELEASLDAADRALDDVIAEPVAGALRQERMAMAARAAREAVALRVEAGASDEMGDVGAVLGAFLAQRWTTVMTFAYSIEADKPGAVGNATRAMDDLIWSVKPKPTQEQRKSLIARLPRLLGTLNKWLDAIKWQEAERLQFFARLAEYHASIVRAPIELAPERQLELALEAARQDALRRVELEEAAAGAAAEREAAQRAALSPLDGLARGSWLEFRNADGARKVKLAWVSPLRTLFIFSGAGRKEAFSLPAEKLVAALHAGAARVLAVDGVVGQVLSEAMAIGAVNDASMLAAASRAAAR